MKSSVASAVSAWVEKRLELPFTICADLIPDAEADGACLRHDPAPAAERRFMDDTRLVSWNLTFYVRCKDASFALAYAKDITDALDGATVTGDDGTDIGCEAATLPQFIDADAKGFTTYSASITCEYLEETGNGRINQEDENRAVHQHGNEGSSEMDANQKVDGVHAVDESADKDV